MPELAEQMYCSQQIIIPPKFPYILKRYCKAAIKTQPYDLLRWSFEYFKALKERRPPPVKLRLEYPVYSTEGGLTRGCLKVLANQLAGQELLPLQVVKAAWQGFCLDPEELRRILCLCEVHARSEIVSFLCFIAVAAGLLTKTLTHTMILLCETLTKEPDGGSAAIPVNSFLTMYMFLARTDASKNTRYINGFREGMEPEVKEDSEPEESEPPEAFIPRDSDKDFWLGEVGSLQKVALIDDCVAKTSHITDNLNKPILGKIPRSPSAERACQIERENYERQRKGQPRQDEEVNKQLRQISAAKFGSTQVVGEDTKPKEQAAEASEEPRDFIQIMVNDEDGKELPFEFYGEPAVIEVEAVEEEQQDEWYFDEPTVEKKPVEAKSVTAAQSVTAAKSVTGAKSATGAKSVTEEKSATGAKSVTEAKSVTSGVPSKIEEEEVDLSEEKKILKAYIKASYQDREDRREDLLQTFVEIAALVARYVSANYDLGMVAGRQMSITSGEFIVQNIEKEIMEYIDEQIAILPDPSLKKKKAKPEEVQMIRELLNMYLDENMDIICPDLEQVEEEEEPIPEIIIVYAVPGIGPTVDNDTVQVFEEYALDVCKVQADMFMPRNIRHCMCPPMEKYIEHNYDEGKKPKKKEEVPAGGGIITD